MKLLSTLLALLLLPAIALAETDVISATATTSTSIYTAGDQIGTVMTFTDALEGTNGGRIVSVSVVDKASQKATIRLLLFRSSPTVASSDNAAIDITDAEMASKYLGTLTVASTEYVDLVGSAVATRGNGLESSAPNVMVESSDGNLYGILMTSGTPTYTGTSDLVINLGVVRE